MSGDPLGYYAALGIGHPYEAISQDGIKALYRARAKETHPDTGGDAEEFAKVQAAYEVLGDKEKRAHYDHTGEAPGEKIDEEMRDGLNVVQTVLAGFFQSVENATEPVFAADPLVHARRIINEDIRQFRLQADQRRSMIVRLAALAKRFSAKPGTKNYPADMIDYHIRSIERAIDDSEREIAAREKALTLLDDLSFEVDGEADVVRVQLKRISMAPGMMFVQGA